MKSDSDPSRYYEKDLEEIVDKALRAQEGYSKEDVLKTLNDLEIDNSTANNVIQDYEKKSNLEKLKRNMEKGDKKYTTKKEREYIQNRRFADALLGVEKGFFARFKPKTKLFTEQEVVNAIIESYNISETDARANIHQYIGYEECGTHHLLRELTLLRNDTLGVKHVRTTDGKTMYEIFTYSRDPAVS